MTEENTPRKIVICATQRSGSTLLCNDLNNNGLGQPEEHFLGLINNFDSVKDRNILPSVLQRGTSANNIFAIKIMASYASVIDDYLARHAEPKSMAGLLPNIVKVFSDAYWIYLWRRDSVSQAVSRLMSRATGISHAIADDGLNFLPGQRMLGQSEDYNSRITLSDNAIRSAMSEIDQENARWKQFFLAHNLQPLTLEYESIIEDFSHVPIIWRGLGLTEGRVITTRNLLKIGNQHSADIISGFKNRHNLLTPPETSTLY